MNNKEFDNIIKKKLESLRQESSDEAWHVFKEKWDTIPDTEDSEAVEDQQLDEKIKKDLSDLRVPFNSNHWIILKEQLELEALFKKKLFVAKSVELVILALIVIGVLNVLPIQKEIYHIPVYDAPMVASITVDKVTADLFELKENKNKNQARPNIKKKFDDTNVAGSQHLDLILPLQKVQFNKMNPYSTSAVGNSTNNATSVLFPFLSFPIETVNRFKEVTAKNNKGGITALPIKNLHTLPIPHRPLGYPEMSPVFNNLKKEGNTYFSVALGPKVNLINSPFDPVYGFDPYNTINTNFNIASQISKEVGPFELYAGIGFTSTSYEPRLVDEIYQPEESQFNVATLENIKFQTFNLPMGVRKNLLASPKVQLYATAGIAFNIIATSEYLIQDFPANQPRPAKPASSSNRVNENAKLSQKEFNKGILSGGSLKDNLYASASLSLGINHQISSHTALFLEPKYSHFISPNGIGPNEDKVHGFSIDLGARFQIN